ncbi:MAG: VanZ family protein [Balneolales bacterium]
MISLLERYPILWRLIPIFFILWTIITLYLTLSPVQYIADTGVFQFDKLGHFAMLGGWTGLVGLYLMVYRRNYDINLLPLIIIGISFGAFVEFLQLVLPIDRSPSFMDMVANSLGCLTAWGILKILQNRSKNEAGKSVH